jgi:hypothetical protein
MKIEELNRGKLRELSDQSFNVAEAIDYPERFKEIGLDPSKVDEIRERLLTLSLEILSEDKVEGTELIRSCISILGQCQVKDSKLHDSILDCLMKYMDQEHTFSLEAVHSIHKLADVVSLEALESRMQQLVHLLETGDNTASWNAAYALASMAQKMNRTLLQAHISRILNVAKSGKGFRKAHAICALGKLYQYADLKEKILDTLLLAAQDPDENTRRAAIFALEDCLSDGTKEKIFSCFKELLEDEAKTVKYGALEALTEALPYKIGSKAFDRILSFLKADEPWVRWRVALALNKAYSELDAKQKEKAINVLRELIKDEDIFVKVRAYEAFLNIKDLEKRDFPEADETLKKEPTFVQQWVLYNSEQR